VTTKALTIRTATPKDSPSIAHLFQLVYGQSSHPCKDAEHVREGICSGSTAWRVAVDQDKVVACVTLLVNVWNHSWELARAVTLPEYRGGGLGTELMQCSVDEACASSSCDVIVGFPRSRTMLHIVSSLKPSMLPVGHDGAINVANGMREYHAITYTRNSGARFRHYIPDSLSLADSEFVRNNIFEPLGFSAERAEYPPQWVVGDGIEHPDLKPFSFGYDPFCPSDAIEITRYGAGSRDAGQVAQELILMLDSFYHARHARLLVPVDKCEFMQKLMDAGFEATAYLPAWYLHQGGRYDCVLMVRRRFSEEPADYGVRDVVNHFRQGLGQR
jgi:GNAT superfamily N-acetyltransferase